MTCQHRWLIDKPDGSDELAGECRKCGERRTWPVSPQAAHSAYALKRRVGTANSRRKA